MNNERNCLSYWFPIARDAGIPVPRTHIIPADQKFLPRMMEDDRPSQAPPIDSMEAARHLEWLRFRIQAGAEDLGGFPVFLRTGQTSHKHAWRDTCHLESATVIVDHILALIEFSCNVDMIQSLPYDVWVVRELLPVRPISIPGDFRGIGLERYRGFPLVPEVRCFIDGGRVLCFHPYWPMDAILRGLRCDHERDIGDTESKILDLSRPLDGCPHCASNAAAMFNLAYPMAALPEWMPLAEAAARAFKGLGAWSCDLLKSDRGWFLTDMADASESFHYPGCTVAEKFPHPLSRPARGKASQP